MTARLRAAALVLAAVAGTVLLLNTSVGGALVARLDHWYDRLHGLGDPCTDRGVIPHSGAYGVTVDLPRCWTVASSDEGGIPMETVLDPGLERSFTIRYVRNDNPENFARAMDAMERRLASPMANVSEAHGWRIVGTASQRPGSKSPNCYFEWAMSNGEVVALAVFEVHKFYVGAPKVVEFVGSIDRALHTVRANPS